MPTIVKPIDPEAHLDIEKQKVTKTKVIDPRDTFELADEDFLKQPKTLPDFDFHSLTK